jgi:hypothetical protein
VKVTNSSGTFARTVGLDQSWSWDPSRLGAVSEVQRGGSTIALTSFQPREVYVFDRHYGFPNTPSGGLPDLQFATLPGDLRALTSKPTELSRSILFQPRVVQLADHGQCSTRIPWAPLQEGILYGTPTQPGIAYTVEKSVAPYGFTVPIWNGSSQPFFSVDPADSFPDTPTFNGISIRTSWLQVKDCSVFGTCEVGVTMNADYAIRLSRKFPKIEAAAWYTKVAKDASTVAAEIVIAFSTSIIPSGMLTAGYVSGDPATLPERTASTLLPEQLTSAFKRAMSSPALAPGAFGITCNPLDSTIGDATCASQQAPPGEKASVRDLFVALTARRIADRMKITLSAATAIADPLVRSLDNDGFWCDWRPTSQLEQLPSDASDSEKGQCRWHPVFRRVNVLPADLELVWTNFGEASSPEMQMINIFVSGPVTIIPGVRFDPRPSCSTFGLSGLEPEGPIAVPRWAR